MLYAAYGSNISTEEMKIRCPKSKVHGYGWIEDYKLVSRQYLDIDENPQDDFLDKTIVPVVIWDIDDSDWDNLDYYEGYPNLYMKKTVKVVNKPNNHERIDCVVYVMTDKSIPYMPCASSYINRVKKGYKEFGFNEGFLNEAI